MKRKITAQYLIDMFACFRKASSISHLATKLLETLNAIVPRGFQVIIVAAYAMVTASLHIDGGQVQSERIAAAEQKTAQLEEQTTNRIFLFSWCFRYELPIHSPLS